MAEVKTGFVPLFYDCVVEVVSAVGTAHIGEINLLKLNLVTQHTQVPEIHIFLIVNLPVRHIQQIEQKYCRRRDGYTFDHKL